MSRVHNRTLSTSELHAFGEELDALRARTLADVGARDARYIRRIVAAVRWCGVSGRALLFLGAFVHSVLVPAWIAGVVLLTLSKILENMELGHNVMHGQYDWMGDPNLDGNTYEWDIVATGDNWRKTHNFKHHTYTNVRGMDDDIGYGVVRIFPEQRWKPFYLMQPLFVVVFALLFQWGVAIQDLRLGRWFAGKMKTSELLASVMPVARKMGRQLLKDYVFFPLLAGPFFLPDAEVFSRECLRNESRGHWYLRQLRGSSNLSGSPFMHVLSGNLSHQIEHHFYPDIPANRYAEIAVEVRAICARYGQNYNTGSLPRQFGQVMWRIVRHAFPSRPRALATPAVTLS
jgi:fatty acid desaturase